MKFFIIIKEHSARVPNKNFLILGRDPLWKHLVNELKSCDVYIDTDSNTILEEAENMNWVTAYKRKQEHINLETDSKFKVSPALIMIDNFLDRFVSDPDEIIVTPHVTSPFIKLKTIHKAIEQLKNGYDSVQACVEYHEFAYYKNKPINFNPDVVQKTQDLEPIVMGNGAFFIFTKKTFKKNKNRTGTNPFFYPLKGREAVEIDTVEDFELATKYIER